MDKLIVVTMGEYSDYCVMGLFKMLKPFDPKAEAEEYLKVNPDQAKGYSFEEDGFLLWLVTRGCLEQVEPPQWGELHMPEYGCFDRSDLAIKDGWGFIRIGGQDGIRQRTLPRLPKEQGL